MSARFCLGTAQFGSSYGISNSGVLQANEAHKMLQVCVDSGVLSLDTAPVYGNGASERLIGDFPLRDSFEISSKFSGHRVESSFNESLERLVVSQIDCLWAHDLSCFQKKNRESTRAQVTKLLDAGRLKRFGVSIYQRNDLEMIDEADFVTSIQLPLSLLDQRLLLDGTIASLIEGGFKVSLRSVFLQGLLFVHKMRDFFSPIEKHWRAFDLRNDFEIIEESFSFVKSIVGVDEVIVGAADCEQLKVLLSLWRRAKSKDLSYFERYAWSGADQFLDPRGWPRS